MHLVRRNLGCNLVVLQRINKIISPKTYNQQHLRCKTSLPSLKDREKMTTSIKKFGQPTPETHPHMLKSGELIQGVMLKEIQLRRERLMVNIQNFIAKSGMNIKNHLIIIPSASKKYMSDKIPYVFRQNSDFLYFTGCQEQDTLLVLQIGESGNKSIMFVRPKDKTKELWDGVITGPDLALELFGVEEAYPANEFQRYFEKFTENQSRLVWYDEKSSDQTSLQTILGTEKFESPMKFVHHLRLIKSPAEINLMRKTCDIAGSAINHTMKVSRPGISEHQIFAEVDYQCRMNGASFLAYPPVVAAGKNATTIHYINNIQTVQPGEMVLMDAGCEYGGYSSDITRTWPIDGNFNEHQRVLYEVVLTLQKDLIQTLLNPGGLTLDELFDTMCFRLGSYLQEINLVPKQLSGYELARAAYKFCPHHVSHYLGMDVHDSPLVSRSNQLVPGIICTVEPGIYISEDRQDVPKEFRGIGLRIEDDILITDDMKVEVLTKNCVKELVELEALIKQ